jgi:hypothetical protein
MERGLGPFGIPSLASLGYQRASIGGPPPLPGRDSLRSSVSTQHSMDAVMRTIPDPRIVLSDVLGSKDVIEGRDGRTDERTRRIVIGRIRVKTELHAEICFYVLSLVNTVG